MAAVPPQSKTGVFSPVLGRAGCHPGRAEQTFSAESTLHIVKVPFDAACTVLHCRLKFAHQIITFQGPIVFRPHISLLCPFHFPIPSHTQLYHFTVTIIGAEWVPRSLTNKEKYELSCDEGHGPGVFRPGLRRDDRHTNGTRNGNKRWATRTPNIER